MINEKIKLFVPRDTTACSLGSDEVAHRLEQYFDQHEMNIDIVRNGSRGHEIHFVQYQCSSRADQNIALIDGQLRLNQESKL